MAQTGLSPRVRGNQPGDVLDKPRVGSIPACAGEPATFWRGSRMPEVYPRVCGGTGLLPDDPVWLMGLSPRVRGNHTGAPLHAERERSIPACAGEPIRPPIDTLVRSVYPRVCGGTTYLRPTDLLMTGLSPRVRGNPHPRHTQDGLEGSIPACAGEPMSCGE